MSVIKGYGYFLKEFNQPLVREEHTIEAPNDEQVIVEVAGCGLCHTDMTFFTGQVKTKMELPLILGHEISGKVVATGSLMRDWMGKEVLVPAVLPCGECDLCKMDRDNICQNQKMPGNDFHGGFASHIKVPGRFLCAVPNRGTYKLSELSVISDAVTTPYQSVVRADLKAGEVAIVIGVGGIGIYMVQHAKSLGAKIIALDIDDQKLGLASEQGAHATFNVKGQDEKGVKNAIRNIVKEKGWPRHAWKVFEMSGTASGQETAFSLLSFAGTVGFIGFTMDKLNVRLSNLMAFDATLFGNWGCRPGYYPEVVQKVVQGEVSLRENIKEYPLDSINEVIKLAQSHKLGQRAILVPK